MSVQLNHTIVNVRDKELSAKFYADILNLEQPVPFGPFLVVNTGNEVSLDFMDAEQVHHQHYAFLVSEPEWDDILERIKQRDLPFWADPGHQQPDEFNTHDGGRGVYWDDPDGHVLEIITRPYGSGG